MKIKSRRLKSNRGNQGEMYVRNNYRSYNDISSGLNSMDFYQQHQSYSIYSKYKYINSSVKRPMRSNDRRKNSRSISPVLGSEEYMTKKIEQTSAIIMRQLLNPNEQTSECINRSSRENEKGRLKSQTRNEAVESMSPTNNYCNKSKTKKSAIYNIDEIQEKIMNHITKLNDGKKKNLINSNMSGYDAVIEQIQKQKRLEISRALRAMCSHSKERKETSDFINSIIPDIGIKIEDLPHDLIEELRNTLDTDPEWYSNDLYYNNPSTDEFSLGSNDIYTDNSVGKFNDLALKTKPTQIIVKSEPAEFDILCKENGQNSRQTNDNIVNKLNSNNVDKLINSNNNYTPNKDDNIITNSKNDSEITAVTVKKEICEQPESEYSDNTYKENQENSTIINVMNGEICQDSEYEYGNYSLQTSSDAEKNEESSITEADCLKLNKTNLPRSFVKTKTCDATEENDNEKDNTELTQRGLLLSVEKSDKQIIQNKTERNTIKNDIVISVSNTSTQTGEQYETHCAKKCIDHLLTSCYQQTPKNISEAINRMLEIDECVLKLTNYRQSLFTNLNSVGEIDVMETNSLPSVANNAAMHRNFNETNCNKESSTQSMQILSKKHKKRKKKLADLNSVNEISNCEQPDTNCISQKNSFEKDSEIEYEVKPLTGKFKVPNKNAQKCFTKRKKSADIVDSFNLNSKHSEIKKQSSLDFKGIRNQPKHLQLLDLHEKILVVKVADKLLVAGTESGKIIFCCLETGHYSKILHICHVPITSLLFWKHSHNTTYMYVGSFDTTLKVYSLHNYSNIETVPLDDRIQCMECSWGYIFIGCIGGSLLRYTLKKKVVEFGDKYSHNSILVLKATQEGARRVLLIGSRNSPVCIRDAMTGLYMRTMEDVISPTVYSLILNKSLLYCGTTNHDILVYSFHDGKLIHRYKATDSKGIGCMKIDRNLLFASCHNGNIYVYDIKDNTFISSIQGPGGVILSMEVFENQVIIGTMSFKFISLLIPQHIQQRKICN
ncbi:putative uncharacterized protein DDB_G0282133 [Anoplophora glabripennis]|uniref:putative uncharacterized protein DDB_G0282133 n=1 Tax=Anoplophora glabripennis TaxID=217634 RepID=UPI000874F0A6|nr:putative uncharacterized protein DDB_G0282133 [Anoplophora glabripennis]